MLGRLVPALLLASCTIAEPTVEENATPVKYREELLQEVHKQLGDPTDIRDPMISEPTMRTVQGQTARQVVCLRFNPKGENGRYSGNVEMAAVYHRQNLMTFTTNAGPLCSGVAYQPYPELSKLCKALNCQAQAGAMGN